MRHKNTDCRLIVDESRHASGRKEHLTKPQKLNYQLINYVKESFKIKLFCSRLPGTRMEFECRVAKCPQYGLKFD